MGFFGVVVKPGELEAIEVPDGWRLQLCSAVLQPLSSKKSPTVSLVPMSPHKLLLIRAELIAIKDPSRSCCAIFWLQLLGVILAAYQDQRHHSPGRAGKKSATQADDGVASSVGHQWRPWSTADCSCFGYSLAASGCWSWDAYLRRARWTIFRSLFNLIGCSTC